MGFKLNIFIKNFPGTITEDDLANLFSPYGKVLSARIVKDRETGTSRCFGFVTMEKEDEARLAIRRINRQEIESLTLMVQKSTSQKPIKRSFISREWREKAEFKE